ncbi:MAG: hypothetical protein H6944_05225 [Zoogloeaceae bacterium]|nr:hypothetical protein [Zoogloeaceae bacterium]HQU87613.1 hypothetical protein [Denitromonas sp.]
MELAILVVYFLRDENIPILDLHLKSLNNFTEGDYFIYGVAPRVSDAVRSRLIGSPKLEMVDVEATAFVGSKEHSYYLNKLCEHAIANGAERLCTMDVDAFPVVDNWNRRSAPETIWLPYSEKRTTTPHCLTRAAVISRASSIGSTDPLFCRTRRFSPDRSSPIF